MELIIITAILAIVFIAILGFTKKTKVDKNQTIVINGIAEELDIPVEEVVWLFMEFGQILMILSQEREEVAELINKRGHLKEYKNWKEVAKIVYENIKEYQKNHPDKK